MNARIFISCAAVLLLAACNVVGPDYQLPAQSMINSTSALPPFQGAARHEFTQGEVPDDWWRLYNDDRLNQLIEAALLANTDLRIAAADLARSEAVAIEMNSSKEVKAGASATAVRAQESGEAYLLQNKIPVENLANAGINISYQIDLVGGLKRAGEAAAADVEVRRAGRDVARISIVADVAYAYTEACAAGHELEIARHNLKLQQQNQSAIVRLVAGGRKTTVELPGANNNIEQIRAVIPGLIARRRIALYQLAVLTGHPPGEYPRALESCTKLPELSSPIPVGDGADLLRRRPDIRQAERALAAATARIGIATAALYPNITLGLSSGATGIMAHLGEAPTQRWSLGPLISWSLPGNLERARLRQAGAATDAALARFDGVVLKSLQEVESALALLARDLDRNTALRQARDDAAEAARQIQILYQAGRLSYLDELDSKRTLASSEAVLAAGDGQVAAAQVKLFLALGGGWR